MSGARALASARRRRAGGADVPQSAKRMPPPPPPVSSALSSSTNETEYPPKVPQKINGATMLLNHNKMIENLQEVVTNLDGAFASQQETIDEKLSSLTLDDGNIEFFKQKLKDLETELRDIKKHILKVQTFAMETNLMCMELKKKNNTSGEKEVVITNEVQFENADGISTILSDTTETEISS
jgi:hypothetical protein